MKFKKIVSAAAVAAICFSMTSGIAVSAKEAADIYESTSIVADMNAADPVWTECMKLAGGRYKSTYVKMMKKYSGKKSKTVVRYGDSKIRSFFNKLYKTIDADEPNFCFCMASTSHINSIAKKGDNIKIIEYIDTSVESICGIYVNSETETMVFPKHMKKKTHKLSDSNGTYRIEADNADSVYDFLGITDDTKGNVFKFKYNDKNYIYEEFEGENKIKLGMLFDSSGNPLAVYMGDFYCISFSTSVEDSEFTVPSDYIEADKGESLSDLL